MDIQAITVTLRVRRSPALRWRRSLGLACVCVASALFAVPSAVAADPAAGGAATAAAHHASARGKHRRRHHRRHRRHHRRHRIRAAAAAAHPAPAPTASAAPTVGAATPVNASAAPLVPVPPCANADTPATGASVSDIRIAVECLVNQARMAHGLPALVDNAKLTTSAQSWTDWMVANGQFTHGNDFSGRISAVGYDWQEAGENIATGYDTPQDVVNAWLASPDHCQNIMDPDYTSMGTGVNTAPVASYATDPSTWTQDFGLTMSQTPPSSNQGPMNGCPYGGS